MDREMKLYQRTHKDFFFACAYLRHTYGLSIVPFEHIEKWLSESEIQDFTIAYMMGSEL